MAKRFRITLGIALLLSASMTAEAHSLSVMLSKAKASPGARTTVYLAWGHALPVDELIDGKDLEGFQVHAPSGVATPLKIEDRSLQAHEVVLEEEGIYQFSAARKPAVFTVVKGGDGKTSFLKLPKSEVKLEAGARIEASARSRTFAKAIACAGTAEGKAAPALGHELEIIPVTHPGEFRLDESARFRVLFGGQPLAGAKVFATCLATDPDGSPTSTLEADSEGVVELTPGDAGAWVLGVYHSLPASDDVAQYYDKDSFYASLTIGIAPTEKD